VAAGPIVIADDDHNNMLSASQNRIPAREHSSTRESNTTTNLVGSLQGFRDQMSVFRQEIRVMLRYVTFPFFRQNYVGAQIWIMDKGTGSSALSSSAGCGIRKSKHFVA
jgi:hypothetical protein